MSPQVLLVYAAALVGVFAAGAYIYAVVVLGTPLRVMSVLALCFNLCALALVAIGAGLHSESHVLFGLVFIMLGTLSQSRATLRRRQQRP